MLMPVEPSDPHAYSSRLKSAQIKVPNRSIYAGWTYHLDSEEYDIEEEWAN